MKHLHLVSLSSPGHTGSLWVSDKWTFMALHPLSSPNLSMSKLLIIAYLYVANCLYRVHILQRLIR